MTSQALLIVDVQSGFINSATRHVVPIVERLQQDYDHIYATRFVNKSGSPYQRLMDWNQFGEDSADVALAFRPAKDAVVIDKSVYTCVDSLFLCDLRKKGVDEVSVCGIDTDVCVSICAVGLFENGIRPVVLANACASHAGVEYHEMALKIMRRLIGHRQIVLADQPAGRSSEA